MKYKEVDLGYNPMGSFKNSNPFTLAFCRTRDHGNVLVKGGVIEAEIYIKENLGPTLVVYRFYYKGSSRGYVQLENCPGYHISSGGRGRKKFILYSGWYEEVASWRRCPSTFPRVLREYYAS